MRMPSDGMFAAKAAWEATIFRRANVVGLAVGNRRVRGQETEEPCILVFVEQKRPVRDLRTRDIVPKSIEGVRTDVVETGRFRAFEVVQSLDGDRTKRVRPATGGVSLGHHRITAGTFGVVAQRNGRPVILSNNHILANSNDAKLGDPILQPGPADGGRMQDTIARLGDFVPIEFTERSAGWAGRLLERVLAPFLRVFGYGVKRLPSSATNRVDAAVAVPTDEGLVAPGAIGIGSVAGTAEARIGMRVRKSGRTTGVTEGRVTGVDAVVEVDYGGKSAIFRGQIVADLLSRGGDSGSLVVDDRNRAVGLLFAGGATTTLINPIGAVSELLDVVVG
jgi:hypothetical protein